MRSNWQANLSGVIFRLTRWRGAMPVAEWIKSADQQSLPGVAYLLALVEEGQAIAKADTIELPHLQVAQLTETQARWLGLPPASPYVLDIRHQGTLDQAAFRYNYSWLRTNSRPVLGARRTGALLTVGEQTYRLPEPLFSLVSMMEAYNANPPADMEARFLAWGRLCEKLDGDSSRPPVQADAYLENTRVAYASRFTLHLGGEWRDLAFEPVLLRGKPEPTLQTDTGTDPPNLLPPHYQDLFAQRFNGFREAHTRYALRDGWYVVVSDELRQALAVVRRLQNASPEERRAFACNPRSYLCEVLDEAQAETLFVETQNYSERVQGIGLWQPKVLPWIKCPSGDTWLPPEEFGLLIGGQRLTLTAVQLPALEAQIKDAMQRGEPWVSWEGTRLPATTDTLTQLAKLITSLRPPEAPPAATPETDKHPSPQVLLIQDNLLDTDYHFFRKADRPGIPSEAPDTLRTTLKPHQQEGLRWLQTHWQAGSSGALLADDMGLGKTLQALTFLAWIRQGMATGLLERRPLLVVAPTGLLKNWEEECERHLDKPRLGALVRAHGPDLRRLQMARGTELDDGKARFNLTQLSDADWILTSYETLRDHQHSFGAVRFATIIFDEAQKIKTPGSLMTEAAKAMNADFTLLMTGTPVENRLADLWCLVDTAQPGKLGDLKSFSQRYEGDASPENLRHLKELLSQPDDAHTPSVMLRRMKKDRLPGLPEKREILLSKDMSVPQAHAYHEAIQQGRAETTKGALKTLQTLRSISLHPFQANAEAGDEAYIQQSARLALVMEGLDKVHRSGEKALIFVESLEMQGYLAALIQRRYRLPESPLIINGAVSGPVRQGRVNRFQNRPGFEVMLLSPRAGGIGLTLTAANHVFHLSRWWNPAIEDQCTDRVYRIGQQATVHVYLPLACHPNYREYSFDIRLHELLTRKRQLSQQLLTPPIDTDQELAALFQGVVGCTESPVPPDFTTLEPRQFEEWVLQQLVVAGYRVQRTPVTGDGGADGIATSPAGLPIIVQCKHTQNPSRNCGAQAINDLIRAKDRYQLPNALLVAVTNAQGFSREAQEQAGKHAIRLIDATHLTIWPAGLA